MSISKVTAVTVAIPGMLLRIAIRVVRSGSALILPRMARSISAICVLMSRRRAAIWRRTIVCSAVLARVLAAT